LEFDDDFWEFGRCLPMEWDDDLLNSEVRKPINEVIE
jgi:hypothetical protein